MNRHVKPITVPSHSRTVMWRQTPEGRRILNPVGQRILSVSCTQGVRSVNDTVRTHLHAQNLFTAAVPQECISPRYGRGYH